MQRCSLLLSSCLRASVSRTIRPLAALEHTFAPSKSPKPNEDTKTLRARLLYQSKKRGILENDILLGEFAEANLERMSHEQLSAYDRLINGEHMEWDLYYYMSGKKTPPPEVQNCSVFQILRDFVKKKAQSADV